MRSGHGKLAAGAAHAVVENQASTDPLTVVANRQEANCWPNGLAPGPKVVDAQYAIKWRNKVLVEHRKPQSGESPGPQPITGMYAT